MVGAEHQFEMFQKIRPGQELLLIQSRFSNSIFDIFVNFKRKFVIWDCPAIFSNDGQCFA